ncbi:LysR family transcriptional regulator [Agrobacterium rhizogenes]|nr:LysR family transcriptional regulator [Rhizobium rhizogenes]NTG32005.1 LysR family transcriptional regulator [Rhizobium rhizogenes]
MNIDSSGVKIRQLQILREVMRAGSERLAAQILRISQPAVSQNIKQLEATIGFLLFRRENNKLIPTDRAWEFLRTVDAAFAGFDRIGQSIEFLRNNDTRIIAIAAPSAFSLETLPRVVKNIREKNHSYAIRVKSGSYQQIADHVLNGRADIGISRLPLDERIFDWLPMGKATNVCVFPPDHRFALKQVITPEDLIGEAIIDIDPQFSSHQMNVNALRFMGVEPEIAVQYDANGHDVGYVMAGVGVSITNEVIAREYAAFSVAYRLFEPGAVYHYVVFWQKDRQLSDGLRYAIEQILASVSNSGELKLRPEQQLLPERSALGT